MQDYGELVTLAEKAASSAGDARLKEIAFTQVLTHLLALQPEGGGEGEEPKPPRRRPARPATKVGKGGGGAAGPLVWLRELVNDGFFEQPKRAAAILEELAGRSHRLKHSDITWPLQGLCHEKTLKRKKIASGEGKPEVWHWSNWSAA